MNGHWDAMDSSRISKDDSNLVNRWSDSNQQYDLKASGENRPKYIANAINNFAALDFTGVNIGLVSDHKYSNGPNDPFTWIMAVKPGKNTNANIFSTSDNNWKGLNIGRPDYHPVAATSHGIHAWAASSGSSTLSLKMPMDELTILTLKYDGNEATVYWGMTKVGTLSPNTEEWKRGPIGYISMGLGVQNTAHDYSGFIGEVLAYNVDLKSPILEEMIERMSTKWTIGLQWKKLG